MKQKQALIGGTGTEFLIDGAIHTHRITTSFGQVELYETEDLYVLLRHQKGHVLAPHQINYRSHAAALAQLGVTEAIGIYAVGSISDLIRPAEFGIVTQFIDLSWGRETMMNENNVVHTEMGEPYCSSLITKLQQAAKELDMSLPGGATYVCTNGPRLETAAEIALYRSWKADVVGMTAATEAIVAKEANICFAALAYSINWAAGIQKSLSFLEKEKRFPLIRKMSELAKRALC